MIMIALENINKFYGEKENRQHVLKNINLQINEGEFVSVIGQSGSGKTTLMNIIGGLDTADSGKILVNGSDYSNCNDKILSMYRRKILGIVFQKFNLIPSLSVYENIAMPIILDNEKVDDNHIDELLHILGISEKKNEFPDKLSGGQQQRVAIARAMANRPKVILADEPTGSLDKKNGEDVLECFLNAVKQYSATLIMVTHNDELADMADRKIVLEDGIVMG